MPTRWRASCALAMVATCAAGLNGASAQPVPDASACVAADLKVDVTSANTRLDFDNKRKHSQYLTAFNVFVTNEGPGACYLLGAPQVTLRADGRDVGAPYSRETPDLGPDAALAPADLALGPLLPPRSVSRQYAELAGAWRGPHCGAAVSATVTVAFLSGVVAASGMVRPPPCRGSRTDAGTTTDAWFVLHDK